MWSHLCESGSFLFSRLAEDDQALEETTGTLEELSISQSETTSSSDNQTEDIHSKTVSVTADWITTTLRFNPATIIIIIEDPSKTEESTSATSARGFFKVLVQDALLKHIM